MQPFQVLCAAGVHTPLVHTPVVQTPVLQTPVVQVPRFEVHLLWVVYELLLHVPADVHEFWLL